MINFYASEKNIRPELLDSEALKYANTMLHVKPTQMRRIFDQVKHLEKRLQGGESWEKIEPLVKMQKAHIAYTVRRGKKNGGMDSETSWINLEKFINDGIESVNSKEDYSTFCLLMEAVYAFYYARTPERV